MQALNIHRFKGMNNISGRVSEGLATPIFIKDAVPLYTGILQKRPGQTKTLDLVNASNVWVSNDKDIYAIVNNQLSLLNIKDQTTSPILDVSIQPEGYKVEYVQVKDKIYCGNKYWITSIVNKEAVPPSQSLQSLQSLNWSNTVNGKVLYLKNPDGSETVIPHPGEFAHVMQPLDMLSLAFGRLWGVKGSKIFYSYPIILDWWEDTTNYIDLDDDITMLAQVPSGLFVGTTEALYFLSGTNPKEMSNITKTYVGIVPNSSVRSRKSLELPRDTPLFMDVDGSILAGLPNGDIVDITKDKVLVTPSNISTTGSIKINRVETLLFKIKGV